MIIKFEKEIRGNLDISNLNIVLIKETEELCISNFIEHKLENKFIEIKKKSDTEKYNHYSLYTPKIDNSLFKIILKYVDENTLRLDILNLNKISITYENKVHLKYKKKSLIYDINAKKVMLYDNTKQTKVSVRELTFKDLKQQVLSFIKYPNYMDIIYIFINIISDPDNKYFLKDIKNEIIEKKLWIPTKISKLLSNKYYNKKDFLKKEYNWNAPKCSNKKNLLLSVLICKSYKHLQKNRMCDYWDINTTNINDYHVDFRKPKEISNILNTEIITNKIVKEIGLNEFEGYENILDDYISMIQNLSLKPNLNIKTVKQLQKHHDNTLKLYLDKMTRESFVGDGKALIKKGSLFDKIQFPDKFKKIKTQKELYIEGIIQHHCVYQYLDKILNGDSLILTCIHQGERYTAEIAYKGKNEIYLFQFYGKYNKEVPLDLENELQDILLNINQNCEKKCMNVGKK